MSYQPNPFVNPNSRDIGLPGGCKDLNEMVQKAAKQLRASGSEGGFTTLTYQVRALYQGEPNAILTIFIIDRGAVLFLGRVRDGFKLGLSVPKGDHVLRNAVADLYGKVVPESDRAMFVYVQLPAWWEDAGKKVIELLTRGYGLSESAHLGFDLQYKLG